MVLDITLILVIQFVVTGVILGLLLLLHILPHAYLRLHRMVFVVFGRKALMNCAIISSEKEEPFRNAALLDQTKQMYEYTL